MKEITLIIPDKEYNFFMKLVKKLGFVKVKKQTKGTKKEKLLKTLNKALKD